ncbi:MAG: PAS domain S-box protein, partial [Pseudomonadota bacterium]
MPATKDDSDNANNVRSLSNEKAENPADDHHSALDTQSRDPSFLTGTNALSGGVKYVETELVPTIELLPSSKSLKIRIGAGFAVLTLAFALVLGILATRISGIDGLPAETTHRLGLLVLWWGFGAIIFAGLIGAAIASQIARPIKELTEELQAIATGGYPYPWSTNVYRNYSELEALSLTMHSIANTVREREYEQMGSERKFREAFDLVGIGLTQIDLSGQFLVVNRRFCEMLGFERAELIGRTFVEITYPEDRDANGEMLHDDTASPNIGISKIKRFVRKDGSILWAQRSGVIVRDEVGKPQYGLCSIEDVSQHQASQEALRALNVSLKAIVETSPLAIFSVTPADIVTLWNPAAEEMFGLQTKHFFCGW